MKFKEKINPNDNIKTNCAEKYECADSRAEIMYEEELL